MSRYIKLERDEIETIRIHITTIRDNLCNHHRFKLAKEYQAIIDKLNETADVRENVRGEWIESGDKDYPCVCSVCGIKQDIKAKFLFSYCPNCGADMRGK